MDKPGQIQKANQCAICFQEAVQVQTCQTCKIFFCTSCLTDFWGGNKVECLQCGASPVRIFGKNNKQRKELVLQAVNKIKNNILEQKGGQLSQSISLRSLQGREESKEANLQFKRKQLPSQIAKEQEQKSEDMLSFFIQGISNDRMLEERMQEIEQEQEYQFEDEEEEIQQIPCLNFPICGQFIINKKRDKDFCGAVCFLLTSTITTFESRDWIKFKQDFNTNLKEYNQKSELFQLQQKIHPIYKRQKLVKFEFIPQENKIKQNGQTFSTTLKEKGIKNVISDFNFEQGKHYWEILINNGKGGDVKIGVCKSHNYDNSSFSDSEDGWAFYSKGQLRHNNASMGIRYGQSKKVATIGVYLNMELGTLSFLIDNDYEGIAFQDNKLKSGPIFAAVGLEGGTMITLLFPIGMPRCLLKK